MSLQLIILLDGITFTSSVNQLFKNNMLQRFFMKNIHGPNAFLLKDFTIKIFEKLIQKDGNFQKEAQQSPFKEQQTPKSLKVFKKKQGEISTVDKEKRLAKWKFQMNLNLCQFPCHLLLGSIGTNLNAHSLLHSFLYSRLPSNTHLGYRSLSTSLNNTPGHSTTLNHLR